MKAIFINLNTGNYKISNEISMSCSDYEECSTPLRTDKSIYSIWSVPYNNQYNNTILEYSIDNNTISTVINGKISDNKFQYGYYGSNDHAIEHDNYFYYINGPTNYRINKLTLEKQNITCIYNNTTLIEQTFSNIKINENNILFNIDNTLNDDPNYVLSYFNYTVDGTNITFDIFKELRFGNSNKSYLLINPFDNNLDTNFYTNIIYHNLLDDRIILSDNGRKIYKETILYIGDEVDDINNADYVILNTSTHKYNKNYMILSNNL